MKFHIDTAPFNQVSHEKSKNVIRRMPSDFLMENLGFMK